MNNDSKLLEKYKTIIIPIMSLLILIVWAGVIQISQCFGYCMPPFNPSDYYTPTPSASPLPPATTTDQIRISVPIRKTATIITTTTIQPCSLYPPNYIIGYPSKSAYNSMLGYQGEGYYDNWITRCNTTYNQVRITSEGSFQNYTKWINKQSD